MSAFGAGEGTFFWSFACLAGYFGEIGLTVSFMMTSFLWMPTLVSVFLAIGKIAFFATGLKHLGCTFIDFFGVLLAPFRFFVTIKIYLTRAALFMFALLTALRLFEIDLAY